MAYYGVAYKGRPTKRSDLKRKWNKEENKSTSKALGGWPVRTYGANGEAIRKLNRPVMLLAVDKLQSEYA